MKITVLVHRLHDALKKLAVGTLHALAPCPPVRFPQNRLEIFGYPCFPEYTQSSASTISSLQQRRNLPKSTNLNVVFRQKFLEAKPPDHHTGRGFVAPGHIHDKIKAADVQKGGTYSYCRQIASFFVWRSGPLQATTSWLGSCCRWRSLGTSTPADARCCTWRRSDRRNISRSARRRCTPTPTPFPALSAATSLSWTRL